MDALTSTALAELLGTAKAAKWQQLTACIERFYEMDQLWNKGFGQWLYEYKYRRGGKTLCTFYAKQDAATLLVVLGKAEREKFDQQREAFSESLLLLYDATESYHDGKWLWIPLDETLAEDEVLALLKLKRRPNRK